ncbi:MAG TPA: type II secretion system F family protein [Acholeplasmataceae bacterium]|nr:type II secretion system F family protein [Acholeplasmataceae bacterium]
MDLRNYKYLATNADGKTVRGTIEALNRNVVVKYLQSKNYNIQNITEYNNLLTRLDKITFGRLMNPKQLIFFLKQLGSLLNAGVKLISALELLSLQQENRNQRKLYFELYQQINNGLSFSKALSKRPKDFPSLLVQMVEVGELSGDLGPTVVKMAEYYESQMKVSAEIKGALRMPLIYLTAAILISVGMLLFVFPNITGLFQSFEGAELPGITQMFLNVGEFLKQYALIIFGSVFILIVAFMMLNKYVEKVHYGLTVMALNAPIFGSLIQMNNQIMIANALTQMLSNGVNSMKALQTVRGILSNVIYKELMAKTLKYIEDGKPFSRAFEESKYIDPIMARMISTGEKTGNIPKLMENLSHYYNGITELRVQQLKNSIQPILLIIVYAIVGVLILAIMLPMLSLGSQI